MSEPIKHTIIKKKQQQQNKTKQTSRICNIHELIIGNNVALLTKNIMVQLTKKQKVAHM